MKELIFHKYLWPNHHTLCEEVEHFFVGHLTSIVGMDVMLAYPLNGAASVHNKVYVFGGLQFQNDVVL